MRKMIALVALAAGVWLLYMGYERQESLAGKADKAVTTVGNKIDGGTRMSTEAQYYAAGAILTVGGVIGLGIIRR